MLSENAVKLIYSEASKRIVQFGTEHTAKEYGCFRKIGR